MRTWLLVSTVLLTGFAPAPFLKPGGGWENVDPKSLRGTWQVTAIESNGVPWIAHIHGEGITVTNSYQLVLSEDRITFQWPDNSANSHTWRFRLSRTRGGSVLNLESTQPDMLPFVGFSRLQGDVLRLSFHESRKGRPKPFGKDALIITLKRHKQAR